MEGMEGMVNARERPRLAGTNVSVSPCRYALPLRPPGSPSRYASHTLSSFIWRHTILAPHRTVSLGELRIRELAPCLRVAQLRAY